MKSETQYHFNKKKMAETISEVASMIGTCIFSRFGLKVVTPQWRIWRQSLSFVISTSDDVIRGSYHVIFFAQLRIKPIGEGKNFHSCNNSIYSK